MRRRHRATKGDWLLARVPISKRLGKAGTCGEGVFVHTFRFDDCAIWQRLCAGGAVWQAEGDGEEGGVKADDGGELEEACFHSGIG